MTSSGERPAGRDKGPVRGLDGVDKQLLTLLQTDGRASYAALAKEVGLSEAAVRQRVQRLQAEGSVQIVGVTDPHRMGFDRWAMIGITVDGDARTVADALAADPAIDYVVLTAGGFDVLAEVVCEGDEELLALVNGTIRAIPGVRSTETFVYLRLTKQTYSWGVR